MCSRSEEFRNLPSSGKRGASSSAGEAGASASESPMASEAGERGDSSELNLLSVRRHMAEA